MFRRGLGLFLSLSFMTLVIFVAYNFQFGM